MATERKYMAYMNSTISHEMRNPLNSISSQIQLLKAMFEDFASSKEEYEGKLSREEKQQIEAFEKQCNSSMHICHSSCKLLMFSVEDILALPQLKDGKFTKNIQQVNIEEATREVMSI